MSKDQILGDFMNRFKNIKNFSDYILIFIFLTLGVSLFYGMNTSGSLMRKTADNYLNKYDLEDIKIVSSHGIDEYEMDIISGIDDLDTINLGYQMDVNIDETKNLISVESIPESWIKYELVEGAIPSNPGEIAVDNSIDDFPYEIGDEITLVQKGNNPSLKLKRDKFKIVGRISSPEFILKSEKGVSSLTGSQLDGYALILPEDFDLIHPNFARIHLNSTKKFSQFTSEYRAIVDNTTFLLREAFKDMPEIKTVKIKEMATERIKTSELEIENIKKDLADTESKVDRLKASLDKQKKEYENKKNEYDKLLEKSQKDLATGESNIKNLQEKTDGIQASYDSAKADYDSQNSITSELFETLSSKRTYVDGQRSYLDGLKAGVDSEKNSVYSQINENTRQTNSYKRSLSSLKIQLSIFSYKKAEIQNKIRDVEGSISRLEAQKTSLDSRLAELNNEQANIDSQYSALQPDIDELSNLEVKYEAESKKLESYENSMNSLSAELESSTKELETVKKDYEDAKTFMEKDKSTMEKIVDDLKKKLDESTANYDKSAEEYSIKTKNNRDLIKQKEGIIARSKEELSGEIVPTYEVTNSGENTGMKSYFNITKRVDMITFVFPMLFFVIALVCVNIFTASLVKKERAFKFLSQEADKTSIFNHYLKNVLIVSGFSILLGIIIGTVGISQGIFKVYGESFTFKSTSFTIFPIQIIIIIIGTLVAVGAPFYDVFKSKPLVYNENTNFLDKTIWLEKNNNYWKKQSIIKRAVLKNIYAYPLKQILVIIGVAAFTTLLLLGISLKRSIEDIPKKQYENIIKYDADISMSPGTVDDVANDYDYFLREIKYARHISNSASINAKTISDGKPSIDFKLMIPENPEGLDNIVWLRDAKDGSIVHLHPNAAVISKKMADMEKLKEGDKLSITIDETTKLEVSVSKIFENYVGNYIFMTSEYYKTLTGDNPTMNSKIVVLKDNSAYAIDNFVNESAKYESVQSLQSARSKRQVTESVIKPLVYISYIYIFSTIVLLYITIRFITGLDVKNRLHEITKAMNDYDNDESYLSEISRQNFISVIIGVLIGLGAGILLFLYTLVDTVPDNIKLVPYMHPIDIVIVVGSILILSWFSQILVNNSIQKEKAINLKEPEVE